MDWTPEISAGDWLHERIDTEWSTPPSMHLVVPRGFEAYARILHPATRDRPVGREWPPLPQDRHRPEWAAFAEAQPEVDTEHVRWGDVAREFGTTLHGEGQWHRIVGRDEVRGEEPQDAAGWRYQDPEAGRLDPESLARAATVLAAHTTTPDDGYVAVWEGWGGMAGGMGSLSASASFGWDEAGEPTTTAHEALLARSIRNPWNDGYAKERWIPGTLSDEASRGARLELPMRNHVLFTGGINKFVDASWAARAPWADPAAFWSTQSPSLIWPADRAWVLVTEVDYDSTIVCGSAALIAALCADTEIEALPLRENADLTWEGDGLNR